MTEPVRVLIVEDNPADVDLVRAYLPDSGLMRFEIESVSRLSKALSRVNEKGIDLLFIDLGLPDSQGLETFLKLQKAAPETPAIILTGNDDEETAATAVRNGAQDYLIKGEIGRNALVRAACYAVERKRAEETLWRKQRMLARTESIAHVGSWEWDIVKDRVNWSDELFRIFQRDPREGAPSFAEHPAFYYPDDMARLRQAVGAAVADGIPYELELRAIRKDGATRTCVARGVAEKSSGGRPDRLFGSFQDITERKEKEQQQILAMEILAALNRRSDVALLVEDILRLIQKNTGFDAIAIRLKEGDDFPYYVSNGFPASFVEAERFLCERDSSGKAALDSAGNPLLECMCGNIIRGRFDSSKPFFSEQGSFWTNSTTDLLASTTEKDRLARTRNRCNTEGYESVALIPLRSGDEVIGLLQLNDHRRGMLTLDKIEFFEEMAASIGIAVARKRAAAAVESSLREKEVLIKEIHHRVKNNMQIISSLLNLQSVATSNEECRGILKEARSRIRSMSLVHEKLYQSHNLMDIDMGDYIQNLADHLFQVYLPHSGQIRLEMECEKVPLDINSSVPCGLLLNELISNALRYAFPDGRKGVLKIGLRRGIENMVELRVEDDGVGFPEEFDFRKAETFGFQIVNMLVTQLEATIELDRTRGAAITVMFRELSYNPRF
jgi:two-component sensor histidine kinase/DNA-binding response OmpR family regulator